MTRHFFFQRLPNIESSAKLKCWQIFSGYTQVLLFSKSHSGERLVIQGNLQSKKGEKELEGNGLERLQQNSGKNPEDLCPDHSDTH